MRHKRELPRPVAGSLLGAVLILVVGNFVRMMFPELLVMNTFFLMTILVLYLSFENPDLFLSDRGSAFNMRAFGICLTEWSKTDSHRLLAFILRDYSVTRGIYGGLQMDKCITLISRYLTENYPECVVFYLRNGSFAVVGSEKMDCRSMCAVSSVVSRTQSSPAPKMTLLGSSAMQPTKLAIACASFVVAWSVTTFMSAS